MLNIKELLAALDSVAPLSLSEKMIAAGEYDNSGIIVNCHAEVKRVLFSLDLTEKAVSRARGLHCDTIVTHHPAIYYPIKTLSVSDQVTAPVIRAIRANKNVISFHLNLDVADGGIDAELCKALGGVKYKMLDHLDESHGYGREFAVGETTLNDYVKSVKQNLNTDRITVYGNGKRIVKKIASFCGGGSSQAEKAVLSGVTDADVIVSSDMPHHIIKELVERNRCVIILTHYAAEEYGFRRFYQTASNSLKNKAETFYFDDKRFR